MSGDAAGARAELARLEKLRDVAAERKIGYWVEEIGVQAEVVRGLAACAEGRRGECASTLRAAADREDRLEKHVVTPGRLVPAREMLAAITLESGDAAAALREYETVLEREPNRLRAFAGAARAAERSGDKAKAAQYNERIAKQTGGVAVAGL